MSETKILWDDVKDVKVLSLVRGCRALEQTEEKVLTTNCQVYL